jgi:hypothetical protein
MLFFFFCTTRRADKHARAIPGATANAIHATDLPSRRRQRLFSLLKRARPNRLFDLAV